MASTPEKAVKRQVRKLLDALGIYYFMPAANGFGRAGIPDFVCCYRGYFLGIEAKAGDNQPTLLQKRELEKIEAQGGFSFVVREENLDLLKEKLECWMMEKKTSR